MDSAGHVSVAIALCDVMLQDLRFIRQESGKPSFSRLFAQLEEISKSLSRLLEFLRVYNPKQ